MRAGAPKAYQSRLAKAMVQYGLQALQIMSRELIMTISFLQKNRTMAWIRRKWNAL
jgi:hypothetical protein